MVERKWPEKELMFDNSILYVVGYFKQQKGKYDKRNRRVRRVGSQKNL